MNRPIFTKPMGDSKLFPGGNMGGLTENNKVTCQFCGTQHPKLDHNERGHTLFRILEMEGVTECCGKVLDLLYADLGHLFVGHTLDSFEENPLDSGFWWGLFRMRLGDVVRVWRMRADGMAAGAATVEGTLPKKL